MRSSLPQQQAAGVKLPPLTARFQDGIPAGGAVGEQWSCVSRVQWKSRWLCELLVVRFVLHLGAGYAAGAYPPTH